MEKSTAHLFARYAQWPPYLCLSEQQIQTILDRYQAAWKVHYPGEPYLKEAPLGTATGNYRAALYYDDNGGHIPWLSYSSTAKINELVSAILEEAAKLGVKQPAFGAIRDPFGLGWSGLPVAQHDSLINHLIQHHAYRVDEEWIICEFGDLQTTDLGKLDKPVRSQFHFEKMKQEREYDLQVRAGSELIGECNAWSVPDYFDEMPVDYWMTIEWIGLEDGFLGRGLGHQLLMQQLHDQKSRGVDHLVLWTERENHRARRFFRTHGFQELGSVVSLVSDE